MDPVLGQSGGLATPLLAVLAAATLVAAVAVGVAWHLWQRLQRLTRQAADTVPAAPTDTHVDARTGLVTLEGLELALARAEERAPPGPGSLCVLLIDLDGFSAVNDAVGHAVADEVLRTVAKRSRP